MKYDNVLNEVMSLTTKMLAFAESDDWEQVTGIESQRAMLIDSMKQMGSSEKSINSGVEAKLKSIIELNSRLSMLGQIKKDACFNQLSSGRKSVKAFNAYTCC